MAGLGDNQTGAIPEDALERLNLFLVERGLLALVEGVAMDPRGVLPPDTR